MFSRRIPDAFELNALARLRDEKRRAGAVLLDLTESNPTHAGLSPQEADIAPALALPGASAYDPDPAGLASAREAVAAYYAMRGVRALPERLVLTASTSEAYAHLFRLLGEPGAEFLVPRPSYPLFEPLAALESVRLVPYSLRYGGRWRIDLDEIAAGGPRVRAVIVVNPNNPTGSFVSREEARAIETISARRGWALIADEVFGDFALEASEIAPEHRRETFADAGTSATAAPPGRSGTFEDASVPLTFVLSGLSKIAGLPQMKLAWIALAGHEPLIAPALTRLEWIADAFLSVSTPVQLAAPALLSLRAAFRERTLARMRENIETLDRALRARPEIERLRVEGGWTAVLRLPRTRTEEEWALALLSRDVIVHPGHFYDFAEEAYLVVSLLPEARVFEEGVRRIVEIAGDG